LRTSTRKDRGYAWRRNNSRTGDVYVLRIDHERTKAAIAEQQKFSALLKVLRAGLT
jgi:hypothetical protein